MNNRTATLVCFLLFLILYGVTSRAELQLTDEVAVFASSVSIIEQGDLTIDELGWLNDAVNIGSISSDGHLFAKYFPGNIFSAALLYRLTKSESDQPYLWQVPPNLNTDIDTYPLAASAYGTRIALRLNAIFGALAMALLFNLLLRHFDWRTAILSVLVMGITTDWWYQSRGFLSEIGAGTLLIISLYFADAKKPHYSGFALGISFLFRPINLVALPVWAKVAWEKKNIWSAWGVAIGGFGLLLYNWIRFGSLLNFGYGSEKFMLQIFDGLYGVLLSPGRSMFLYSPVLTLAIPGAWLFYKKEKALTFAASVTVLFYVLVVASWHSWDGGWSWGSRLLTPILPILGFLSTPAIESAWSRRGDIFVVIGMAVLGLGIQLAAMAMDPVEVLTQAVVYNGVNYNETINSIGNSWLALQVQSLDGWQVCSLDAYTLRQWIANCGY